ncbi:MAG TPA: glycosyltransferase family 39 protein [Pseudolysinimonas sp.]|nr:glycosyltransferase family 39 protein [Pseudolysinimonas sp.]
MRRPVLTLLLLAFVTFGVGLGRQAITEADEAYYAEASREMAASGDWITPRFNFENRWQKPVLYYWLTAATYQVAGPGEGAARLWSALSGAGLVMLVWAVTRRREAMRPHAWLAGAITATCFGYFAMARAALPDLPLAFCITLTITAAFAAFDAGGRPRDSLRWWALAGLATGLGCLMKGPVAVVVPALAVAPAWWFERRDAAVRWPHVALAALIAAAVALPWYAAMVARHGLAYVDSFVVGDNLERFTTTRFNDKRPLWFYLPVIAGGLLPWSAYGVAAAGTGLAALARRQWHPSRDEMRLLCWAIVPTLFFAASVGQQPRYVLPVLPPLAILMARAMGERIEAARRSAHAPLLRAATWTTALVFVGAAALLYRLQPLLAETSPVILTTSAVGLAAVGAALAVVALRSAWSALPAVMTAGGAALLVGVQFSVFAPGRPAAVERMAAFVTAHRLDGEAVGTYHAFTRNLVFYTRLRQTDLFDAAGAARFLAAPERVLLVLPERDLPEVAAAAGVEPQRLARVQHLNTAYLRLRSVLNPDPAVELETVVLVSNR